MAIPAGLSMARYIGDGQTRVFSFRFKVWDAAQIRVFLSGQNGDEAAWPAVRLTETGGEVEFASAPAKGRGIAILRNMPFEQDQAYANGSRFDPAVIEERFDQDCAERQQLREAISRAVKAPASSGMKPEDYEREFWQRLERGKADALDGIAAQTGAFTSLLSEKEASLAAMQKSAGQSEKDAAASLAEMRQILAGDFANGVRQALAAASASKEAAASIDENVREAAEAAAACIALRAASAAQSAELHANAAAQSACQSAMNREKMWVMVRSLTRQAGEDAAACILERASLQARMAAASSRASAASAATSAGLARTLASIIGMKAKEVAEQVAGELMDCLENVCTHAAEISTFNMNASAASAETCAAISASMRKYLDAAAANAAKEAGERVASCAVEACNALLEMCVAQVAASAANARLALEYAKMAEQADVCEEAAIRREMDAALLERIEILEQKILGDN